MSKSIPRILLMIVVPLIIVVIAVFGAYVLISMKAEPRRSVPVAKPPLARTQKVHFESVALTIQSQGTVNPKVESQLISEVSGSVIEVGSNFEEGSFFEKGERLLKLDPFDYRQALIAARADLARAKLNLAMEEAEAKVARAEWEQLGNGEADPLTLRIPQLEDAKASVEAAQARLVRSQRDLERTEIHAPYAGRILSKTVEMGQFVNRGTALAMLYSVDKAEVRLPVPDKELPFINVPLHYRDGQEPVHFPEVTLSAKFGDQTYQWQGLVTRTESKIDPQTRMVHLIAEVEDPFGQTPSGRPPLAPGMYVHAEIQGVRAERIALIPREALWGEDRVLVVDSDERIRFTRLNILRTTQDHVFVKEGIADGARIVISRMEAVTDGMKVRIADANPSGFTGGNKEGNP